MTAHGSFGRNLCLLALLCASSRPAAALTLVDGALKVRLTLDRLQVANDRFRLKAAFVPAGTAAPDVSALPVTVAIGPFSQTVAAGAFAVDTSLGKTTWIFKGAPGGLKKVKITDKAGVWGIIAVGGGLTLAGAVNPITVALDLGADHGERALFFSVASTPRRTVLKFPPRATQDADGDGLSADSGDCNDQDPSAFPGAAERCNGADDDCDGTADEGFALGAACTSGQGICRRDGVTVCAPDGTVVCGAAAGMPGTELCGNGADDDCDGATDEGFNVGAPCAVGTGPCARSGFMVCAPDGAGTVCEAPPVPGCEAGPAIAIVDPPNLSFFNRLRVTVSGTVGPEAVQVACNAAVADIAGGGFSVTLTLEEGNNIIACVARDADGNARTVNASVTVDTQPPRVTVTAPGEGATLSASPVTVTGLINDVVVGTVNQQEAQVDCNGVAATVANRSFVASGVSLVPGANTITCAGTDRAGNADTDRVDVTLAEPSGPALRPVSGDGQTGVVASTLPAPLVVALTDDGTPLSGRAVLFQVQRNDGTLTSGTLSGRRVAVVTDENGRAQVSYTLGTWAGAGSNTVLAVAPGFPGEVLFIETATPGPPAAIVVDSGDDQEGVVEQRLPRPFVAVVVDAGGNRLAGVPVVFGVVGGGGNLGGQPATTVTTDGDGRAQAVLTLGPEEGVDNNIVAASFAGNAGPPATFTASGRMAGNPAETRVSGVVLDNTNAPIAGVTVGIEDPESLTNPRALLVSTQTDAQGQFALQPVPVGHVVLQVEGATAARPGTWPRLEYDMVTVAGRTNTVGMPIYLLPIDVQSGLAVDDTQGGTIALPEVPGFALTIAPGSVTFLDGTTRGTVSVTLVHPDKVPMVPNFGQQPRFVVTIQPAGVHFNPPAPLTIPNVDALAPGQKTEMYSFDHDLGQFVSIGPGTVSEDGALVVSDPGVGVIKGGWHSAGPPAQVGTAFRCDDDNPCTTDTFGPLGEEICDPMLCITASGCRHDPMPDGAACSVPNISQTNIGCGDDFFEVAIDTSCRPDATQCSQGLCGPFGSATIARDIGNAISQFCRPGCVGEPLRTAMRACLRDNGLKIKCDASPPCSNCCAYVPLPPRLFDGCLLEDGKVTCTNEAVLTPLIGTAGCSDSHGLASVLLHEMVHGLACDEGGEQHNTGAVDPTDRPYGCQESCYPGRSGGRGNPAACR